MLMSKNKRSQLKENINTHNNKLRKAQPIYTGNDKYPDTTKLISEQKHTKIGQNLAKPNYNTENNQEVLSSLGRSLTRLLSGRLLMIDIVIKYVAV